MIKTITVINHLNQSFVLELRRPELSGFAVTSIDGIGPVDANIISTEAATKDGSYYNSSRLNTRNIILHLTYIGNDIEALRITSYRMFLPKSRIKLIFETDVKKVYCYGLVESNDPDIFNSNVSTQISILCPDPYFHSYENFNLHEPSGINFNFTYDGEYEVGFITNFIFTGNATKYGIWNLTTGGVVSFNTDVVPVQSGDTVTVNSRKGEKVAYLKRGGTTENIMRSVNRTSSWITFAPGLNVLRTNAESGVANFSIEIEYDKLYGGI